MTYRVRIGRSNEKMLAGLDKSLVRRIYQRLQELALDPYSPRISKPLKMLVGQRSSRVGDWRITYRILDEDVLEIMTIVPRGKAYEP